MVKAIKKSSSSIAAAAAEVCSSSSPKNKHDDDIGTKLISPERREKKISPEKRKIMKKTKKISHEKKKKKDKETFYVYERIILPKILPEGSTTIYATNLLGIPGRKIVKADFDEFFKKDGKVVNVEIKYKRKRDWDVDFTKKLSLNHMMLQKKALKNSDGRLFIYTFAILDISLNPSEKNIDRSYTQKVIYVCGFGNKTIESWILRDKLKGHFSSCGEIIGVSTPDHSKSELSKGYAFIQFKDFESMPKALEKDGTQFMLCTLQVRKAKVDVTIADIEYSKGLTRPDVMLSIRRACANLN